MSWFGDIANAGVGLLNWKAQKDNLAYQKEMQKESWARDDSALQRRVADAEAAGLNPQLALGSGASNSGVVATSAPQANLGGLDFLQSMYSLKSMKEQIAGLKRDNKLKDEQSKINEQIQLKNVMDIAKTQLALDEKQWNMDYYKRKGMPTDASTKMTEMGYLFDLFKNTKIGQSIFGSTNNPSTAVDNALAGASDVFKDAVQKETNRRMVNAQGAASWDKYHKQGLKNRRELDKYKQSGQAQIDNERKEHLRRSGYWSDKHPWS